MMHSQVDCSYRVFGDTETLFSIMNVSEDKESADRPVKV